MNKIVLYILVAIITSFGFFPVEFTFFTVYNTKTTMATIGLALLIYNILRNNIAKVGRDFFYITIAAGIVSLMGVFSCIYNDTNDYTYSTYIVSMFVWMGSAYLIVNIMRAVHGIVSVRLIANYLIAVCVVQCIIALAGDMNSEVREFIDSVFVVSTGKHADGTLRMYGIGASLDVAGTRFSAVLVMIAALCMKMQKNSKALILYLLSFIIITVIGNMISRTTIVGVVLSILYWLYMSGFLRRYIPSNNKIFWAYIVIIFLISISYVVYQYNNDPQIHKNIRFAFEGFFSLWEKGEWQVSSNDRLSNMVVFPDNLKTWIIGDGYFDNPLFTNPYYIGKGIGDFYMNTDIGYLRFIFYFGLLGTIAFIIYFLKAVQICMRKFSNYKLMFFAILLVNYIVWFKVSTDIFLVFSYFLCISEEENDEYERQAALENGEIIE